MRMQALRFPALILLLAAVLAGCAGAPGGPPRTAPGAALPVAVSRLTEQGGKFIALVGPRSQHAEPFLGVPGTNIFALRSWIDSRTGETVHQLYVADSYVGGERNWDTARDAQGQALRFIAITKNEISCGASCSYAEEFAAALSEPLLRASPKGLSLTFAAKSGASKTIAVTGDLVAKQLAAVDEARAALPKATAVSAPPAPPR
jgi:hypothetical protein